MYDLPKVSQEREERHFIQSDLCVCVCVCVCVRAATLRQKLQIKVTVYGHRADQSRRWPYIESRLAGQ